PHGQTPLLHPPSAGRRALVQQLRPALPRSGTRHRRAAAAPSLRLPPPDQRTGRRPPRLPPLPLSPCPRHAAAPRVPHRPGTPDHPPCPVRKTPERHAPSPTPPPPHPPTPAPPP